MGYRLNMGIMVMNRMIKSWPDSPVTIIVLSDSDKQVVDVNGSIPVINSKTSINVYRDVNNIITSHSKYLEDWYLANKDTHRECVEHYKDILHYLDFTGYCYKERSLVDTQLPTLIVVSNNIIVDRNLWEPISLNQLKSLVNVKSTETYINDLG